MNIYQVSVTARRGRAIYEDVEASTAADAAASCIQHFQSNRRESVTEGTVTKLDDGTEHGLRVWFF